MSKPDPIAIPGEVPSERCYVSPAGRRRGQPRSHS